MKYPYSDTSMGFIIPSGFVHLWDICLLMNLRLIITLTLNYVSIFYGEVPLPPAEAVPKVKGQSHFLCQYFCYLHKIHEALSF
jgi:hypothetical protein